MEDLRRDPKNAQMMDAMMNWAAQLVKVDRYEAHGSDTAMGKSCTNYYGYRGNQKVMEVCVLPNGIFSTARKASQVSKGAASFLSEMVPAGMMQKQVDVLIESSAVHLGFPVKVTRYFGKHVSGSTEISQLSDEWFTPSSVFDVPAGYKLMRRS